MIKVGTINTQYGRMLKDAFDFRQKGDYAIFTEFSKDEVIQMYEDMKEFIKEIETLLDSLL